MTAEFRGKNLRWWVLATVGFGVFMATLDASIVNISLPSVMVYFQTTLTVAEWFILVYLLVITALLLPFGRLADILGRKKVFSSGLVLFSLGSALCSLSQSPAQLILFRAVQAIGAAMIMATGFAIITSVFPPKERGRALGIQGTVVAAGFTVGPALGGFLISALGWRSVFYVNVPIGIIGALMCQRILEEKTVSPLPGEKRSFDFAGAALVAIALTALLMGMTTGQEGDWGQPLVVGELIVAAICLTLIPIWEARSAEPLISLSMFRNRLFSLGNLAGFLSFLGISANAFLMPLFLQLAMGFTPLHTGLLMTPTALAIAVVAPLSGWLSDRIGPRILTSLGLAVSAATLVWISMLSPQASYQTVLTSLVLLGIGQGLFQSPNNSSVMSSAPRESLGVAGGFLALMRNMGQAMGLALAGTIVAGALVGTIGQASLISLSNAAPGEKEAILKAFIAGMHRAYLVAAIACFLGVWASLTRGKQPTSADIVQEEESVVHETKRGNGT